MACWDTLLDRVRESAGQAGEMAANAAYVAGKKAEKLIGCAKSGVRKLDLEAEINLQLRELGEMLYATHTGTPTDSEALLEKMQKIDALKAELSAGPTGAKAKAAPSCGSAAEAADTPCGKDSDHE